MQVRYCHEKELKRPKSVKTRDRKDRRDFSTNFSKFTQPAFACSKLTIEALGQGVKYVKS